MNACMVFLLLCSLGGISGGFLFQRNFQLDQNKISISRMFFWEKKNSNPKLPPLANPTIRPLLQYPSYRRPSASMMGSFSASIRQWMLTRGQGPSENPEAILVVLEILPLAMKKIWQSEKRLKKSVGPLFCLATKHYKTHAFLVFFHFLHIHF